LSPRKRYSFFIDPELEAGLKELKAKHGTPEAEAIRRAIAEYLVRKGIAIEGSSAKSPRRRASTRQRS
jgi:hypothetical protein